MPQADGTDGEIEGFNVGTLVGVKLGRVVGAVGHIDGTRVGMVGVRLGRSVRIVGFVDGISVGLKLGLRVGFVDGISVGLKVGLPVGLVGCFEGTNVGLVG